MRVRVENESGKGEEIGEIANNSPHLSHGCHSRGSMYTRVHEYVCSGLYVDREMYISGGVNEVLHISNFSLGVHG